MIRARRSTEAGETEAGASVSAHRSSQCVLEKKERSDENCRDNENTVSRRFIVSSRARASYPNPFRRGLALGPDYYETMALRLRSSASSCPQLPSIRPRSGMLKCSRSARRSLQRCASSVDRAKTSYLIPPSCGSRRRLHQTMPSRIPDQAVEELRAFQDHLVKSDRILALCGAGLSVASGLSTFRGAGRIHQGPACEDCGSDLTRQAASGAITMPCLSLLRRPFRETLAWSGSSTITDDTRVRCFGVAPCHPD